MFSDDGLLDFISEAESAGVQEAAAPLPATPTIREPEPQAAAHEAVPELGDRGTFAPGPFISLATALDGDSAFEWGDAVAIVQQLIEQLIPDGPGQSFIGVPAAEAIGLDGTGALHAQLEPHAARPASAALGEMLRQLSAGIGRPPALRLFAMRAIGAAPAMSLDDFRRELADWAPPNCRERLAHIYLRAREREQVPIVAAQVGDRTSIRRILTLAAMALVGAVLVVGVVRAGKGLMGRRTSSTADGVASDAGSSSPVASARPSAAAPGTSTASADGGQPPAPSGAPLPASTGVGASAAPAPGGQVVQTPAPKKTEQGDYPLSPELRPVTITTPRAPDPRVTNARTAPAGAPAPRKTEAPPAATGRTPAPDRTTAPPQRGAVPAAASAPPARTRPAAGAPGRDAPAAAPVAGPVSGKTAEEEFQRARGLFDRRAYAAAADGFARVMQMIPPAEGGGPDLRFVAGEYLALSRASLTALQSRVYTKEDAGVIEPVPRGQFLPAPPDPGTPAGRLATLELLIDTQGNVESARLAGESSQFRSRWWVSAAKAWRFRPAMKDDNPVKFLKRIVVADSKPLEPR